MIRKTICLYAVLVFAVVLLAGIFLASRKQLWTDELLTQRNVQQYSYTQILRGDLIKTEGNPCPLYYLLQKTFLNLARYQFPFEWKSEYCITDTFAQVMIRIINSACFAIGAALLFIYFSSRYRIGMGFLSVGLLFANPMSWLYIAEARPYGLWLLLSLIQFAFLDRAIDNPKGRDWFYLVLCHMLLSLTIVFSLWQVLVVSAVLVVAIRISWQKVVALCGVPATISYAYYLKSKQQYAWINANPMEGFAGMASQAGVYFKSYIIHFFSTPITMNLPWAWLIIIVAGALIGFYRPDFSKKARWSLLVTGLLVLGSSLMIELIAIRAANGVEDDVAPRYFIFLAAAGVWVMMRIYLSLAALSKDVWEKAILNVFYGGAMIVSICYALGQVMRLGIYF